MISEIGELVRKRTVAVGVGDERHGDDGFGPMLARRLAETGWEAVIDAGSTPEMHTAAIRRLEPEAVLFLDAVDLGGPPGATALLDAAELRSQGFDTHRMPLKLTMRYLESELACSCKLLAVQPADVRFGAPMCEAVVRTIETLSALLDRESSGHTSAA